MSTQKQVVSYFKNLDKSRIDQCYGEYSPTDPCCVGAHLAHILGVVGQGKLGDYTYGIEAWCGLVGGNRLHAVVMLRECGAPRNPFDIDDWEVNPAEVFAKVYAIEELPDLCGRSFERVNLRYADLSGADLREVDFTGGSLEYAVFRGANLEGANFRQAYLRRTDFKGANLKDANFEDAHILEADFKDADLEGANFQRNLL